MSLIVSLKDVLLNNNYTPDAMHVQAHFMHSFDKCCMDIASASATYSYV